MKKSIVVLLLFVSPFAFAATNEKKKVIDVAVTEKGFEPNLISVNEQESISLKITRKTDNTCSTTVQIPSQKVKKKLPLNKPVVIELGSLKKGEIKFGCGMNMMDGGRILVN
jgi:plastocyanin domain-containing protein